MYYLSKYACNLLTATESSTWRVVHLSNKIFQEKVQQMHGATQILAFMGYTESDKDCMKFPIETPLPDHAKVTKILCDLVIATVELKHLIDNKHPNPSLVLPPNNQVRMYLITPCKVQ